MREPDPHVLGSPADPRRDLHVGQIVEFTCRALLDRDRSQQTDQLVVSTSRMDSNIEMRGAETPDSYRESTG